MEKVNFLKVLAKDFEKKRARLYLVGGRVRDFFLEPDAVKKDDENPDFDLLVKGLNLGEILRVLQPHGSPQIISRRTSCDCDKEESIVHFRYKGFLLEISPARRSNGSKPLFCPNSGLNDDASVRDFTMNAIYYDPLEKKFHDPLGGIDSIKNNILSLAGARSFVDDPLRIMRAFSFISRYALKADERLLESAKQNRHLLATVPKDRFWPQWRQWSLSSAPHLGLIFLEEAELLDFWPQLSALKSTPQSKFYHPEGDVWRHSVLTVEHMATLDVPEGNREALMLTALLHDIGKPLTTKIEGKRISSPRHAQVGEEVAAYFLENYVKAPQHLIKHVCKLIGSHMNLCSLEKASPKSLKRLNRRLAPESNLAEFWAVVRSDYNGRGPNAPIFKLTLEDFLAPVDGLATVPPSLLKGRDLLAAFDLQPGPLIGKILKEIDKASDEGLISNKEQALDYAAGVIASAKYQ